MDLRASPLVGEFIFDEKLVSQAGNRLQGDVSLKSNTIMLDSLAKGSGPLLSLSDPLQPYLLRSLIRDPNKILRPRAKVGVILKAKANSPGNPPKREKAVERKGRDVPDVWTLACMKALEVPPLLVQASDQSPEKIAGRLSKFSGAWSEIGADPWVMCIVQWGYKIPFVTLPPLRLRTGDHMPQGVPKVVVSEPVSARAAEQGSDRASSTHPRLLQPLVPCHQGNRGVEADHRSILPQCLRALPELHYGDASVNPRGPTTGPVVNVPRLERCLLSYRDQPSGQTLLTLLSQRHRMAVHSAAIWVVNLSESIHQNTQTGTSICPSPSGKIAHVPRRLVVKPRDTPGSSRADILAQVPVPKARVGLNLEKSDLIPSHVATYLGIELDTLVGLARPSHKRVTNWLSVAEGFTAQQSPPAVQWLQVLGHLVSLEKLVPYGRIRIRPIQWQLRLHWIQSKEKSSKLIPLDLQSRFAILWWTNWDNLRRGVPIGTVDVEYYLYTDSCTQGWGAHLQELTASGIWSQDQSQLHVNVLELQAIWLGLKAFSQRVENAKVALMSDNTSAVAYLRNQGGTKSLPMSDLATYICLWAEKRGMTLIPCHLPGHLNVLADHLSRRGQILNQTIADRIFRAWGRPFVDLFALRINTKLATYISPIREETSWKVDSLVQNWDGLYTYTYPPTSLIRACLNKVRTENVEIVLIVPGWPNQEWFPDLLDLAIDFPIISHQCRSCSSRPSHTTFIHIRGISTFMPGGYQGIPQGERIF